jgi:uncharacterized membrane protein
MCITQAADIFGTVIVAGAFLMGTVAFHPAFARPDASHHIILRQEMIRRLQLFLPPFMLLPIPASIAAALTLCHASASGRLDALGCALSVATVGIKVTVNGPLNRRFARWSPDALPRDWQRHVRRWNLAHSIRMAVALGAFACAIFAAS